MKTYPKAKKKTLPALNLLELVILVTFIAIIFTAGFQVYQLAIKTVDRSRQSTLAELMAQDLLELAISKRNEGWTSLTPGAYHFVEDPDPGIGLIFAPDAIVDGEFSKVINIYAVNRDASGNIVTSGGTEDENTFLLEAVVSWHNKSINEEIRLYEYVTNWKGF